MHKTLMLSTRIEPKLKNDVEKILHSLGLSSAQAVRIFFEMVRLNKGIPFDLKIPNQETLQAALDAKNGKNMETMTIAGLKKEMKRADRKTQKL